MKTTEVFSSKAEKYARYRWDYAPQAIKTIFETARLTSQSVVADIGAGTGILTRHFMGKVKQVIAIEPNAEMRQILARTLADQPGGLVMDALAEATTLPDHSLDLITAAQAANWFDPQPTRAEFERILKPGGWLAILRNNGTDTEIGKALEPIYPASTDTALLMKGIGTPGSFYFGLHPCQLLTFPFSHQVPWDEFFGALCSASYAPDETNPLFTGFERAARAVFQRFSQDGLIPSNGVTELVIGSIT
jgi:SAM-dependent methyltransferase